MTDTTHKLQTLAKQVQQYQLERSLTDAALFRKVPSTGSTKTYKKILDGDFEGLNLEKQLVNYEGAIAHIAILREKELPPEPEYDWFTNVLSSRAAVARAFVETTIARLVVIEGENGTGKDASKNFLEKQYPETAVVAKGNSLWRDNHYNDRPVKIMLADWIRALEIRRRGDKGEKWMVPKTADGMLDVLKEEFTKQKYIFIINDGHHLGPGGMNLLINLIDETLIVPVIVCIPKLLKRLRNSNYEEAAQLFGNRLCECVTLPSPPADEIGEMLTERGVKFDNAETRSAATLKLKEESPMHGNWRFVNQVTRECRLKMNGSPLTLSQFSAALSVCRDRRIKQQKN